jgi:pyruvate/2-oxoglutarate dehydrogenase complex dihydrolipoamide acyltransferase (E2) component
LACVFAVRRPAAILAGAVLALTLVGCTSDEADPPEQPQATSTPLSDFATDDVSVTRGEFCARVAPDAIEEALAGEAADSGSWANGDRTKLAAGVRDVAHEYGCSWTAADGTVASAWVFAPPVTPARAKALAQDARGADECQPVADAPAYGARSAAVRCGDEIAFHGLFGDAWLSCSLRTPSTQPDLDRAGRWCVAVAQAASAD